MPWSSVTTTVSGGLWQSWTPLFSNGSNQWNASNMTFYDCRYCIAEGTAYVNGNFALAAGTDYGTGTGNWQLWMPSGLQYADAASGSRQVGWGYVYDNKHPGPWNAALMQISAGSTFDGFFVTRLIRYQIGGGGNWNGGTYNNIEFKRSELSNIAGGTRPLYCTFNMRYILKPGY